MASEATLSSESWACQKQEKYPKPPSRAKACGIKERSIQEARLKNCVD
jgi:hypothetical protein